MKEFLKLPSFLATYLPNLATSGVPLRDHLPGLSSVAAVAFQLHHATLIPFSVALASRFSATMFQSFLSLGRRYDMNTFHAEELARQAATKCESVRLTSTTSLESDEGELTQGDRDTLSRVVRRETPFSEESLIDNRLLA